MSVSAPAIPSPSVPAPAPAPVLAEVVRSGFVEGRHRGSLVVLDADGAVELALGDVTAPVFPAPPTSRCRRRVCCGPAWS